ncbi:MULTISPECIES: molybdopterin converting factor subunit 1 [unclassified Sutcliffiella]|jgi:molybdopterin synthase sulfur carrier subunit|uniref:molybdopterin converting factor subunit 1 n=1 Tax=unclassified Sutcliffiella TaxID=2837532 RepID=UPI0030CE72DE
MIKIQFFAHLREKVGQDQLMLDFKKISVKDLLEVLANSYQLQTDTFMVAVNEEYADIEDVILEGDTVALIPPVSGG